MTILSQACEGLFLNDDLSAEDLTGSLMNMNGMKLLEYALENDGIKLTKAGAFNRECVEWAVQEFQWPDHTADDLYQFNKVLNEGDVLPLMVMHELLRTAKLLRRYKGKALISKSGAEIMDNHGALQALLFETFLCRFDFTLIERFIMDESYTDYRHFLGVVGNRLNDWTLDEEFSSWCLPIHPNLGYSVREGMFFFVLS